MNNFLKRTCVGALYVIVVVLAIYSGRLLMGHVANPMGIGMLIFNLVFLFVGVVGTWEINDLLRKKGLENNLWLSYLLGIFIYIVLVSYFYQPIWGRKLRFTIPALLLCVMIIQLWRRDARPFATIGYTILPTLWVMIPLALMAYLHRVGVVMMIFILIWINDSFAYLTGRLVGHNLMWIRHSPKKTWEGTIGGAVFCIAGAELIGPLFHIYGLGWIDWLIIGLICSVVGTLGDLVESMFKRSCGVKDSGKLLPGHGGILDRFDSMLMTVPFVLAYLVLAGF